MKKLTLSLLALVLLVGCEDIFKTSSPAPQSGGEAPAFTLPTLRGESVSLSEYRGKLVLINFWATWCPPCVEEMPSMEKLYKKMKGKPFEILAVSTIESESAVKEFVKKNGFSFSILLDKDGSVAEKYGVFSLPETYILDRDGKVVENIKGPFQWDTEKAIEYFNSLLEGKKGEELSLRSSQ